MTYRAIYVKLLPGELALLKAMAAEDRRPIHEQAAHLVSLALHRWQTEKLYEASIADAEAISA